MAKEKAADESKAPRRCCQDEHAKTMMMMWMRLRGQREGEEVAAVCSGCSN